MARQQYVNLGQSTLVSSYTAGDTSLHLSSGGGAFFPTTGDFTVAIDDPVSFFLKCTARSSDTLTVINTGQEGTTAVNKTAGTKVTQVLSVASFDAINADRHLIDVYANLPGSGMKAGDRFFATNSPYEFVYDGALWRPLHLGRVVGIPGPASGWTQVNPGTNVTLVDLNGAVGMTITNTASLNWRICTKNAPATPYHVEFNVSSIHTILDSVATGVHFYDGTKIMTLEGLSQNAGITSIRVAKITNVTTALSTAASTSNPVMFRQFYGEIWYRLGDDGTNITFDYALEPGYWVNLFTEARGTFMTPTQYGFGGICQTASTASGMLIVRSVTVTG